MATLEERIISGKGLLRVPDNSDTDEARILTLYASVFRRPVNQYLNFAYNPPKSRYATLNFFRETFLLRSVAMEFPSQSWDFSPELNYQNLYALDCVYEGILQTFVNLGNALNLVPVSVVNNISSYRHTKLWFDEIKVVCYADTAIKLTLESKPYDFCPGQEDYQPDPPPPPPPVVSSIPPGTPLGAGFPASPAYDGNNDNGDSVPFDGDESGIPPQLEGDTCSTYTVRLIGEASDNNGGSWFSIQYTATVYGEYSLDPIFDGDPTIPGGLDSVKILARGRVALGEICGEIQQVTIQPFSNNWVFRNLQVILV